MRHDTSGTTLRDLYDSIRPRYPELHGQVALVTGSGRGIGKGIAIRLAREGMKIVITGLDVTEVETTATDLRALDVETLAVPGDLGRSEEVNVLFQKTLDAFGSVDVLVNNAATIHRAFFFEVDDSLLNQQVDSNIRGPYMCAVRAAEIMRRRGTGETSLISVPSAGRVLTGGGCPTT